MSRARRIHHLTAAVQRLLGSLFLVAGLNGFLDFLPRRSAPMPPQAAEFLAGLGGSGYLLPLLAATELVAGMLLIGNRWVPLALAFLAPVVVNIVLFHLFLVTSGLAVALPVLAAELYLAWSYRTSFAPMLAFRADRGPKA